MAVVSLALGAAGARAQTVVANCEQLLVVEASSVGRPAGTPLPFVLGVSREPDGGVARLVLGPSDEGFLCVPAALAVAAGTSAARLGSGEDVYVRGFGGLRFLAGARSAATSPKGTGILDYDENKKRARLRRDGPVLTRAE
jgi:hypothetical protein